MSNLRFNYLYVLQIISLNNDLHKISNTKIFNLALQQCFTNYRFFSKLILVKYNFKTIVFLISFKPTIINYIIFIVLTIYIQTYSSDTKSSNFDLDI